ncbi:amidohydrolase family protein [Caulobacter endophyticus]|uniref:amidohydrolase family protein n=1 Tax=Caulobacter endophyticus TaxID=2172652 RepID=UPI00240EBAEB|nr:amidohydrolase family protein [Caulobacter endophyticus]MDG2527231.1 amidohydrolase family protein [Caulobacter endophyticus]
MRFNLNRRGAALAVALAAASPATVKAQTAIPVDHHMHVHSPAILKILPAYCDSPKRKSPCDPRFTAPLTADDALKAMDQAGIGQGWLMSTAYLAESPLADPLPNAGNVVHAANDFTVGLARARPDRFAAFVSVNPNAPDALAEIARWKGDRAVTGLKLHLTNSDVDLRDPADTARLAAVFRAASDAGLIIMIHMRTRAADYGARDVRLFLDEVLPAAGGGPVVIAHAAGWGGIDAVTLDALGAFAEAFENNPASVRNLRFDLAQVFNKQAPQDQRAKMAALVRRIRPDRFVAGSDWPFAGDLKAYFSSAYAGSGLSSAEWDTILR